MNPIKMGITTALVVTVVLSIFANIFFAARFLSRAAAPEIRTVTADEALVMRTEGGALEVSSITVTEFFDTTQKHILLGVPLANTVARIRVPAHYRYHIELAPEWTIHLRDTTFIVITPPVKPSRPVAIDTSRLESETLGAWSLLTGAPLLEQLQKSISPALDAKAETAKYIELQRESARKTVAEFVEKWLLSQARWKSVSGYQIRVFFADEPIQALEGLAPPRIDPRSSS